VQHPTGTIAPSLLVPFGVYLQGMSQRSKGAKQQGILNEFGSKDDLANKSREKLLGRVFLAFFFLPWTPKSDQNASSEFGGIAQW
jgi:hypothetical protein